MADDAELPEKLKLFTFDFNTMINFEEVSGKPFTQFDPSNVKEIRMVIWCGIKDNLPDGEEFSLLDAGRLMDNRTADRAIKFVMDRMGVHVGEPKN